MADRKVKDMADNTNALATVAATQDNIGKMVCSIKPTGNRKEDAKIFAALNNPEFRLANFINKTLKIQNVLVEIREIMNDETGEIETAPRVVLISEDGKAYQAVSKGIFNAVKNAYEVFGQAPWDPPLEIEVKQVAVGKGSMLTFDVLG